MFDIEVLGENIRYYRKKMNLTQGDLAKKLFVSFQAISNWERGSAPPDLDNIIKLSQLFNVSVDRLLKSQAKDEKLYIGIDGGATKTEICLFTPKGQIAKLFQLSGTNPWDVGIENAISIIIQGIEMCRMEFPEISGVYMGMSGIGTAESRAQFTAKLENRYDKLPFTVDSNAINVMSSGNNESNLALICGAGSILYKKTETGCVRYGGWGYLLDYAGSGYDLGRDAIVASLEYEDGTGEYTEIYPMISKIFGGNIGKSTDLLHENRKPIVASMAKTVFDAHKMGDRIANEILNKNTERLSRMITCASEHKPSEVVACGGIIENYKEILIPKILENCPKGTKIIVPDLPSIYGACKECLRRFNVPADEHFHDVFYKEYNILKNSRI